MHYLKGVNELVRALKDARDLVEALLGSTGQPPEWLAEEARRELLTIDELLARLDLGRTPVMR